MRRTTPLSVAGLLGLALLVPTSAAAAAGETCRGEAATIVGTGPDVRGTDGRDVIVTGASLSVDSLGGDDLVCAVPDRTGSNVLYVDTGDGNDLVDTTSAALDGYYVDSELGAGADTLEGGPAGDWVDTGDAGGSTADVDVVRAGDGGDTVTTSGGSDVVELGPGTNRVHLEGQGFAPGGRLVAGPDHDTFAMAVSGSAEHAFDMAAGTYRTAGASVDLSSFEALDLEARGARVTYSGTEAADHLLVETFGPDPSTVVIDTLGGDDDVWLDRTLLSAGSSIDTGAGDDDLVAARPKGRLGIDLDRDRLRSADVTVPATGVEDAFLIARTTSLVGDAQDNTLITYACSTTITAGAGDDELIWDPDYIFEEYSFRCTPRSVMRGGAGDDSFYATRGDDRLVGGNGADTIRGEGGDDRVRAGKGDDRVEAGAGDDDVRGGAGADTILGDEGRDRLLGDGGRDLADGGTARDRCVAERERRCER